MYLIGVFGKIGAGKSSVINLLKRYIDAEFLYADDENRELLKQKDYVLLLKSHFSDCFVGDELQKELLKNKIFSDEIANEKLKSLSHSIIKSRLYSKIHESKKSVIFVEVSVFVDNFLDFDEKWLITASNHKQIKRLKQRDSIDEETAKNRIQSQYLPSETYFDRIIINDGDFEQLSETIKTVVKDLKTSLNIDD